MQTLKEMPLLYYSHGNMNVSVQGLFSMLMVFELCFFFIQAECMLVASTMKVSRVITI